MFGMQRRTRRASAVLGALVLAASVATVANAKAPVEVGDEGFGNNLSVPALFVPDTAGAPALRLPLVTEATAPVATADQPVWYDEITFTDEDGGVTVVPAGYYYEQKSSATWQADWDTATTANVIADWGDNLTGSPNLKARQPIRVEVVLFQQGTTATGLQVVKLTDDLDRNATYGTLGALDTAMPVRVFDAGATISIKNVDTGVYVVPTQVMTAEINSTGGIVYGFNWGIQGRKSTPTAGTYELTFTANNVELVGLSDLDALRVPTLDTELDSTTLTITLTSRNNPGGGSVGGGGGPGAGTGGGGGNR